MCIFLFMKALWAGVDMFSTYEKTDECQNAHKFPSANIYT